MLFAHSFCVVTFRRKRIADLKPERSLIGGQAAQGFYGALYLTVNGRPPFVNKIGYTTLKSFRQRHILIVLHAQLSGFELIDRGLIPASKVCEVFLSQVSRAAHFFNSIGGPRCF